MEQPSHVWPDWSRRPCVIVASGPSAAAAPLDLARDCTVLAINSSWRLAPWATALYACDLAWWQRDGGAFAGMRFSVARGADRFGARLVPYRSARKTADMVLSNPPEIALGGNSGFQAVNLAAQLGARRIILVGFDMRADRGVHWHGAHRGKNPDEVDLDVWRRHLDRQAPLLAARGVEVINASEVSALEAYRKMKLEEALGHCRRAARRVRQVRAGIRHERSLQDEAAAHGGCGR